MSKRITIDPITRLEGHGKIEIFLTDEGDVDNVYFQVPELRGFEKFCEGRPVEELAQIVTKICGVCPGCHHMASGKAADAVYGVEPPPTAKKLRELFYMAHFVHSHIAHFYALAAPDFVVGPDADPSQRNILGVIGKVGKEIGTEVIMQRKKAQEIQALLGALQESYDRPVVAVFQPHRYTRTRDLMDDFASVLSEADLAIVLEVYAAGEDPIAGADGRAIARATRTRGSIEPVFVASLDDLKPVLDSVLADGDLVLLMGAGDIGAYAAGLPELLATKPSLKVHS